MLSGNRITTIYSNRELSDFEYADNVVPMTENRIELHVLLDHLNRSVGGFEMRFLCSRCKMRLDERINSKPNLIFPGDE